LFEFFGTSGQDEQQDSHARYGSRVISVLSEYLTPEEKAKAQELGFIIEPGYVPQSSVSSMESGFVDAQGAVTKDEFGALSIVEIAKRLRTDWTSQSLREKFQGTDHFLKPHNAEGVGSQLKTDVPVRLQEYVDSAELFFDRQGLEAQYTYSYLRGVEDALKANSDLASSMV
jgi:hypothetical protein